MRHSCKLYWRKYTSHTVVYHQPPRILRILFWCMTLRYLCSGRYFLTPESELTCHSDCQVLLTSTAGGSHSTCAVLHCREAEPWVRLSLPLLSTTVLPYLQIWTLQFVNWWHCPDESPSGLYPLCSIIYHYGLFPLLWYMFYLVLFPVPFFPDILVYCFYGLDTSSFPFATNQCHPVCCSFKVKLPFVSFTALYRTPSTAWIACILYHLIVDYLLTSPRRLWWYVRSCAAPVCALSHPSSTFARSFFSACLRARVYVWMCIDRTHLAVRIDLYCPANRLSLIHTWTFHFFPVTSHLANLLFFGSFRDILFWSQKKINRPMFWFFIALGICFLRTIYSKFCWLLVSSNPFRHLIYRSN